MQEHFASSRLRWSRIVFAVLSAFLFLDVFFAFEKKVVLWHTTHQRLRKAQMELQHLERENIRLKEEKEALWQPEKIEALAREKLGLAKPHEIAVKIISVKRNSPEVPAPQGKQVNGSKGLWGKIKEELPLKWLLTLGRS